MNHRRTCAAHVVAAMVALLIASVARAENVEPSVIDVGVATVDITPDYPIRLNGFGGRRAESEGVTQRIHAKALAFGSDKQRPAVLVTVDSTGVPDALTEAVAATLKARAGIDRERFVLSVTHTHTAPKVTGALDTIFSTPIPPEHQAHIDRYTRELTANIENVALEALANRKPSRLAWTQGTVTFAANRRNAGGPVDHDLPMLIVTDAATNKPRAIYVSYACHCVTLSHNKISGDWAGYAQQAIEAKYPGVTALVSIGGGADANPSSGVTGDNVAVAAAQGREILDEVDRLMKLPATPLTGALHTAFSRIDLPLEDHPDEAGWRQRAAQGGPVGYHAQVQLDKLARGEKLITAIDYPVQTWAFGDDLAIVFLAGELVVDYAHRIKREFDGERVWVNGYCNAVPCYIPSERVLREGGYEGGDAMVYFDVPTRFRPGLEQKIMDAVHAQVPDAFAPVHDARRTDGIAPLSPQRALASIRVPDDMVIELVAAEPLVVDPVAIDWGVDGTLWVCEMHDYPEGIDGKYQAGGRIATLRDSDGDGKLDQRTVFIDNMPFPTGVTVWRDGVLICTAPDILFARDTDGDGKADEVKKLYTGFHTGNYQARINSLHYGLDGWVYASMGLFGGRIESFNGTTIDLGSDCRINPDTGAIEPAAGMTQQGRVRSDFGDWFGCDSGTLFYHYPLHDHYVRRNAHLPPPAPRAGGMDIGALRTISRPSLLPMSGAANQPTSGCGLGIYRDTLLGEAYDGNAFSCEPVHNVVVRMQPRLHGTAFIGHRPTDAADAPLEFFASNDPWCRPVQARTGPDGALYVVDMHRFLIEHPIWVPAERMAEIDARAGSNRGRIYRIYPRDAEPRHVPRIDALRGAALAAALDTPNGTLRDLVHQQIVWTQDRAAIQTLSQLARQSDNPAVRVQAMAALDGLDALDRALVVAALEDEHAGVRREALRLAETHVDTAAAIDAALAKLAHDPNPLVRLQLAASLGAWEDAAAGRLLARVLMANEGDAYIRGAAMSSALPHLDALIAALFAGDGEASPALTGDLIAMSVALMRQEVLASLITHLATPAGDGYGEAQFAALGELLDALARRQSSLGDLHASAEPPLKTALGKLDRMFAVARSLATDTNAHVNARRRAAAVLGRSIGEQARDIDTLARLLSPQTPGPLQDVAIQTLGKLTGDRVAIVLLDAWAAQGPARREAILSVLLSRESWTNALLDRMNDRPTLARALDATRRQLLTRHRNAAIRDKAARILGEINASRQEVIDRFAPVAQMQGDAAAGEAIFTERCAQCHALGGVGRALGADLAALSDKSAATLLTHILDPNRAVLPQYIGYDIELTDWRTLTGIIESETSSSITLKTVEGETHAILRKDIVSMTSSGLSFMPEGLEVALSHADMANLIAFVQAAIPDEPRRIFAGNTPRIITQADNGALALRAADAEIYGDSVVFEQPFANLGYWHSERDRAVWQVKVDEPGDYDVWLDFACDDGHAGKAFVLTGGSEPLRGRVHGTGAGWSHYQQHRIGAITLGAGAHRFTLRSDGAIASGALFDLRTVMLVPAGSEPQWTESRGDAVKLDAKSIAKQIIAAGIQPLHEQFAAEHPDQVAEIIAHLTVDLDASDPASPGSAEEYRRIPAIWTLAIALARTNNAEALRRLLDVSLPHDDEPLRDWQAVVIGGGVINGLSQRNLWPGPRIDAIIGEDTALMQRWRRAGRLSIAMAHDVSVPAGTRYDALRMIGTLAWRDAEAHVLRYLPDANAELQMGAVSALIDIDSRHAAAALIDHVGQLTEHNRNLALDGLLRDRRRAAALQSAIAAGRIDRAQLGDARLQKLETLLKR